MFRDNRNYDQKRRDAQEDLRRQINETQRRAWETGTPQPSTPQAPQPAPKPQLPPGGQR